MAGSGNHLVDYYDWIEEENFRLKRRLDCGCMDYCKCEDNE